LQSPRLSISKHIGSRVQAKFKKFILRDEVRLGTYDASPGIAEQVTTAKQAFCAGFIKNNLGIRPRRYP
jgi:hypothetical protein